MKKALLFDPYMTTLGGGERYVLSFALGLIKEGYSVELAWPTKTEINLAQKRFGLNLSKVILNPEAYALFSRKSSIPERRTYTKKYDLVFWVSDGSLPFLFSKNNLVHLQVPFKKLGGNPVINSLKTVNIHKFVYNSEFTKSVHEKHLPKSKGFVLYPPIDVENFLPGKKENLIVSVARFDSPSHSKRQDILIEAFRIFSDKNKDYKLALIGGLAGGESVLEKLRKAADGLNVEFIINPDFEKLKSLYSRARFFWHAAGFTIDESMDPEKVEHFGMTTVEAMASGAVPVVIAKGGQKEIVTADSGFLCQDERDIAETTLSLIGNPEKLKRMSINAVGRSKYFSLDHFFEKISQLL